MNEIETYQGQHSAKLEVIRTGVATAVEAITALASNQQLTTQAVVGVAGDVAGLKEQLGQIVPDQLSEFDKARLQDGLERLESLAGNVENLKAACLAAAEASAATANALQSLDNETAPKPTEPVPTEPVPEAAVS